MIKRSTTPYQSSTTPISSAVSSTPPRVWFTFLLRLFLSLISPRSQLGSPSVSIFCFINLIKCTKELYSQLARNTSINSADSSLFSCAALAICKIRSVTPFIYEFRMWDSNSDEKSAWQGTLDDALLLWKVVAVFMQTFCHHLNSSLLQNSIKSPKCLRHRHFTGHAAATRCSPTQARYGRKSVLWPTLWLLR